MTKPIVSTLKRLLFKTPKLVIRPNDTLKFYENEIAFVDKALTRIDDRELLLFVSLLEIRAYHLIVHNSYFRIIIKHDPTEYLNVFYSFISSDDVQFQEAVKELSQNRIIIFSKNFPILRINGWKINVRQYIKGYSIERALCFNRSKYRRHLTEDFLELCIYEFENLDLDTLIQSFYNPHNSLSRIPYAIETLMSIVNNKYFL